MKKRTKKKEFILIQGTIFPFDILYTTACDHKVYNYISKNKKYTLNDEEKEKLIVIGRGKTIQLRGGQVILRVLKEKTQIGIDLTILSHEIEHAIYFILSKCGVKHTEESDELYAYYQQYLMKYILDRLDK
jgi:hypothetical protein